MTKKSAPTRILVTGANGYVGRAVVRRLLAEPSLLNARFHLLDSEAWERSPDPRARFVVGDLRDPEVRRAAIGDSPDLVIHLAGVLGGAAEADYDLAKTINVDATLALFEALRCIALPPRLVFASSIAVFGPSLSAPIDDNSPVLPTMIYGAQKLMMEAALGAFSRRGEIDGIALRLPGIVARPDADARMKSAFLNLLFHNYAAGRDMTLPVSAEGTTWLLSRSACAEAIVHAALLPPDALGPVRSITLPALRISMKSLIEALSQMFPASQARISFEPEPAIEQQFAAFPELETRLASDLGFRPDADLTALIEGALEERKELA